jgi:lysophospholipase L1-like esterase
MGGEGRRRVRSRARALIVNLSLSLVSALVIFGGIEIFLRFTGLAPSHALRSPDLATLDRIPGIYEPGQEFTDLVRRDLPSEIRINNLGFRGRDLPEAKGTGTFRVMALGDSYTFGDHVDTEEAYPAQLERILAGEARGAAPVKMEVINAGANGFGILDMQDLWVKAGRRLDPDVVLITFTANDISDMTRPVPIIRQMRRNAGLKSGPLLGTALRMMQKTALFNGMQILAARWRVGTRDHDAIPALDPARAGPDSAPEAWEAWREVFLHLVTALRDEGRRPLLVLYPSPVHVAGEEPFHAAEALPGWAEEAGIPWVDLLPAMRAATLRGEVLYLVPRDSHPTAAGHRAAAEGIARKLQGLGWIPGAAGGS